MRNRLFVFALATMIGLVFHVPATAQQSARATLDELKQGGFVVVVRH